MRWPVELPRRAQCTHRLMSHTQLAIQPPPLRKEGVPGPRLLREVAGSGWVGGWVGGFTCVEGQNRRPDPG